MERQQALKILNALANGVHPATGEQCEWIVPLADDFAGLIAQAGIPEPEQV